MNVPIETYVVVCSLVFLAGFIDAIAGGGGLISLPAYYAAGLPPALAAGSNKLSGFMGTAVATYNYAKKGYMPWKVGLTSFAGSFVGSMGGAWLVTVLDPNIVKLGVLVALPLIAIFVLVNKDSLTPRERVPKDKQLIAAFLIGIIIGFYDGLVGPGTGTFLQLMFISILGMEALMASGAARLVNLGSNVGALLMYMNKGVVLYSLALPASLFGMLGNYLGSTLAIKRGTKVIRTLLVVVLVLLMAKIAYDLFFTP